MRRLVISGFILSMLVGVAWNPLFCMEQKGSPEESTQEERGEYCGMWTLSPTECFSIFNGDLDDSCSDVAEELLSALEGKLGLKNGGLRRKFENYEAEKLPPDSIRDLIYKQYFMEFMRVVGEFKIAGMDEETGCPGYKKYFDNLRAEGAECEAEDLCSRLRYSTHLFKLAILKREELRRARRNYEAVRLREAEEVELSHRGPLVIKRERMERHPSSDDEEESEEDRVQRDSPPLCSLASKKNLALEIHYRSCLEQTLLDSIACGYLENRPIREITFVVDSPGLKGLKFDGLEDLTLACHPSDFVIRLKGIGGYDNKASLAAALEKYEQTYGCRPTVFEDDGWRQRVVSFDDFVIPEDEADGSDSSQ